VQYFLTQIRKQYGISVLPLYRAIRSLVLAIHPATDPHTVLELIFVT